MAFEVEVKAHVDDPRALQVIIESIGGITPPTPIDKEDWYFARPGERALFRLRREAAQMVFTRKHKGIADGIETNEEFEFTAPSDQGDAAAAFFLSLGYEVVAKKNKRGLSYSLFFNDTLGDVNLELCEVSPLGWFIEVEFVLSERSLVKEARRALIEVLALLTIPDSQVEARPYLDLLSQSTG